MIAAKAGTYRERLLMKIHLINYDLNTPGKNYDNLINAVKAYGKWAKVCKSCWAIKTDKTDTQIRDNLKQYIDANDILFVCTFDSWASYGLPKDVADWLKT